MIEDNCSIIELRLCTTYLKNGDAWDSVGDSLLSSFQFVHYTATRIGASSEKLTLSGNYKLTDIKHCRCQSVGGVTNNSRYLVIQFTALCILSAIKRPNLIYCTLIDIKLLIRRLWRRESGKCQVVATLHRAALVEIRTFFIHVAILLKKLEYCSGLILTFKVPLWLELDLAGRKFDRKMTAHRTIT